MSDSSANVSPDASTAKVATARRLAIRLYWMWRQGLEYEELVKFGSHAGQPGNRLGRTEVPDLKTITMRAWVGTALLPLERNGAHL